jgi:hypothetical protein
MLTQPQDQSPQPIQGTGILKAYAYRMWIEEMFGDFKKNGFDFESTHLRHYARLSRLTLAVALLYAWLIDLGRKVIENGLRHWVDRAERRDLVFFKSDCGFSIGD